MSRDRRYTLAREWCGFLRPQWVVRFCDAWVGCAPSRGLAVEIRDAHAAERAAQLRAWSAEADAAVASIQLRQVKDIARRRAALQRPPAFLPA